MCRPVFEQTARLSKMFFPGKRGMRGNKKSGKPDFQTICLQDKIPAL